MAYANEQAQRRNESEIFPNVNLHEPFVRIGHHVYVNNRRFYPIKRIKKILKWHEYVAKEEDISRTKRVY